MVDGWDFENCGQRLKETVLILQSIHLHGEFFCVKVLLRYYGDMCMMRSLSPCRNSNITKNFNHTHID